MIMSEFESTIRPYMNYSDRETVLAIKEASSTNQNQMLVALTSKLYEMIVAKVANIDYSTVESSRGDITKMQNYDQLLETVSIIKGIVAEYRCDISPVMTIQTAMDNIKSRTSVFKKAFVMNSPVPMLLYNNICMCIVSSVSFLIDTAIEYIKNPQSQSFQMALDVVAYNKTRDNLMFESLSTFNKGCQSGDIDAAIKACLSQSKTKHEAATVSEGYKFNNPDNFTLRLVHSCVKAIRKGREKGITKDGIERQVMNIIEKRLNSVDTGGALIYVYTLSPSNMSHSTSILRTLQSISLKSVQDMERNYNAVHGIKRTYTDTYNSADIEMIKKCAKEVRKTKVSVHKESLIQDLDVDDFMSYIRESLEEISVLPDSPFMDQDDIDNPDKVIVNDDSEGVMEFFDGFASLIGRGLIALCKLVIPLIRHIVYLYFYSRQRISDHFESNATLLEMNAYQLQYNNEIDPDRRAAIVEKQLKIAAKQRKKAERTSIDYKRAKKEADKAEIEDQRTFTTQDLSYNPNDETNDTVQGSVLF